MLERQQGRVLGGRLLPIPVARAEAAGGPWRADGVRGGPGDSTDDGGIRRVGGIIDWALPGWRVGRNIADDKSVYGTVLERSSWYVYSMQLESEWLVHDIMGCLTSGVSGMFVVEVDMGVASQA